MHSFSPTWWFVMMVVVVLTSTCYGRVHADYNNVDHSRQYHVRGTRRRMLTPTNDVTLSSSDVVEVVDSREDDPQQQQQEKDQEVLISAMADGTSPTNKEEVLVDQLSAAAATTTTEEHLNILAIGGSVTWGATLEKRELAYPWVLGDLLTWNGSDVADDSTSESPPPVVKRSVHVDNLSIRATGADFFSICIESLIEEVGSQDRSYDLILIDFTQNGTDGFPFLLERLRERYPNAILVYIKLYSIVGNAIEVQTAKNIRMLGGIDEIKENQSIQLRWKEGGIFDQNWMGGDAGSDCTGCDDGYIEDLVREAGGYVYDMKRPANPRQVIQDGWFDDRDWHHLSAHGHSLLANELMTYLRTTNDALKKVRLLGGQKPLGPSWNGGDQCHFWFMSGQYDSSSLTKMSGVTKVDLLQDIPTNDHKWVMELNKTHGTATLVFESKYTQEVPLGLGYMSRMLPKPYSSVVVNVNQGSTLTTIDPTKHGLPSPTVHITKFQHVGYAKPGRNTIQIHTLPSSSSVVDIDPFRIVGLYLCEACIPMGNLG